MLFSLEIAPIFLLLSPHIPLVGNSGGSQDSPETASGHRRSHLGTSSEHKSDISDYCSQMILQPHEVYDPNKISVKIKIVSGNPCGAVASEAKKIQANWVVLDKHLKHEKKQCMEELQCNIVDSSLISTPGVDVGSRSGRMWSDRQLQDERSGSESTSRRFSSKLSLESRPNSRERDYNARTSYEENM